MKFKESALARRGEATEAQLTRLLGRLQAPAGAKLEETAWSAMRRGMAADGETPAGTDFLYLRIPPGLSVEDCLEQLKKVPELEYAEPDGIGRGGGTMTPTDPSFGSQWHHKNSAKPSASIRTPEAWAITTGSSSVTVAVLDTGVNTNLSEFSGRLVAGAGFVAGNTSVLDDHGHGTMAASTVCANANNGKAGAGVDWNCKLMPVKVLDQNNYGLYSWWAQGINFAVANGAKVINLSSGGTGSSSALTTAINNAIAKGVIFVTITHNDGTGVITYPGTLTAAITVGASDRTDKRCTFSNYGSAIDLVAPGIDIYGMARSGGVEYWWGTSFAAPQVAGVASLLCALRPDLTQAQVRTLLCAGADDRVGDATDVAGFDHYYGTGRLNAYNSLLLAQTAIDRAEVVNDDLVLSWPAPDNAPTKKPYEIWYRDLDAATWSRIGTADSVTYQDGRAVWTRTLVRPGLYQIAVR